MFTTGFCRRVAVLACAANLALADLPIFVQDPAYTAGEYGPYPVQAYESTNVSSIPRFHITKWHPSCNDGQYYFVAPHGLNNNPASDAMIFDSNGNLIWHKQMTPDFTTEKLGHIHTQVYNNETFLIGFRGIDAPGGFGSGSFYMFDETYTLRYNITGQNGVIADNHEFLITDQGTAVFTAYGLAPADLSRWNESADGQAWDSLFQEVDIETGELLFQWRASDHFTFDDMVIDSFSRFDVNSTGGFDWFHINSVDKDPLGNYLISGRYASSLAYIDGKTGDILWTLGGRNNSFIDISDEPGAATSFLGQHNARWADDYTAVTLFDNGATWAEKRRPARGLKIALDRTAPEMTAKLVLTLNHSADASPDVWAESQGSLFQIDNGNFLMGYGYAPVFSEYSPDGELLCDIQWASPAAGELLQQENADPRYREILINGHAQNYRTYKLPWVGRPKHPPDTAVHYNVLWMSWNGATEVRRWVLERSAGGQSDTDPEQRAWDIVGAADHTAFESGIPLDSVHRTRDAVFALIALDADGTELGRWLVDVREPWTAPSGLSLIGLVALAALLYLALGRRKSVVQRLPQGLFERAAGLLPRRARRGLRLLHLPRYEDSDVHARAGLLDPMSSSSELDEVKGPGSGKVSGRADRVGRERVVSP